MIKAILFFFFLCIGGCGIKAQKTERHNTFSYNVNEGLLQSTIGNIAIDKNNFCWITFPKGVQKFDGKNFINVPVQAGFPDDNLCDLFQCNNGDLLISHSKGISKYEINRNRFVQIYTSPEGEKKVPQFLGEDGQVIYIYSEAGNITGIDFTNYSIVSQTKTGFPAYASNPAYKPAISDNVIDHTVALLISNKIYLWDLKKAKLIARSPSIEGISYYLLKLKTPREIIYTNKNNKTLRLYNFSNSTNTPLTIKEKDNKHISRCNILTWGNKTLLSINNRLFETDSTLQKIHSELLNYQNEPPAGHLTIARIKEDYSGNLYLVTITGGIRKIIKDNYPIKYFNPGQKNGSHIMSILPDKKNNRILAGTSGKGLFVFDTLQRLVKHINISAANSELNSINTIIKNPDGDYILFVPADNGLWQLSNDLSRLSKISFTTLLPKEKSRVQFFGHILYQDNQRGVVQTQANLYNIHFESDKVNEHYIANGYFMGGMFYNDKTIITHANDELIFLDAATFQQRKKIPFPNTGYVRCFARDNWGSIYAGSNNGIFKIDTNGKILQHLNKTNGLPDECIYAIYFDSEGQLWCSTNKGILKISNYGILHLKKEDGLQENEFNTNVMAASEDGEVFFGGVNGISSFYPSQINAFKDKPALLLTGIKVNNEVYPTDTAYWMLEKISLPYHKNSLSFDFIAIGSANPEQYIYQYKMRGIDNEWIQNNGTQPVRYYLKPGKYVFQLYASRFFESGVKPVKEIEITIHPPFWKTWWFLSLLGLLVLLLMAYVINRYNKRKFHNKIRQMENERRMQQERERISLDLHDNIGAYANAVLYSTELLEKANGGNQKAQLMSDLKFASKDIITSLRATVWALKKDSYTPEECLLRIRNFIQPFTRYYPHIQFKVEGEASANKKLHYTKALNVVRIVQEAVANAIKHASPAIIRIESKEINGKWQLTVTDNGKGFKEELIKGTEQGNGLTNMRKRAIDSNFELYVVSHAGQSTEVTIIV